MADDISVVIVDAIQPVSVVVDSDNAVSVVIDGSPAPISVELAEYVVANSIIDNLSSHNAYAALSANMGRVLDESKFNDINTDLLSLYRLPKGE